MLFQSRRLSVLRLAMLLAIGLVMATSCIFGSDKEESFAEYSQKKQALQESICRQRMTESAKWPLASSLGVLPVDADVLTFPRICGSPALQPIGMTLTCRLLGADYAWSTTPLEMFWRWGEEVYFMRQCPMAITSPDILARRGKIINRVLVVHDGTANAYEAIVRRQADLILTIRKPLDCELLDDCTNRVALSLKPVAVDGLAFIVPTNNPVSNLSRSQLHAIYMDAITNWAMVGGKDYPIDVLECTEATVQTLMREQLHITPPVKTDEGDDVANDQAMHHNSRFESWEGHWYFEDWGNQSDAVGYETWYFYRYMVACPYSKAVSVDGVAPSSETIRSGRYPLIIPVYAVIRADEPAGSGARRLWDWLSTPAGQAVIRESGYVPVADYRGPAAGLK